VKIAIVGAGGRLGKALARAWSAGDEVLEFPRAAIDLSKPGEAERVLGPASFDALVNCAALTNVDYCESHVEEAMQINAHAAGEIGTVCAKKKARCLHISTDYVFDGEIDRPYTEDDAARAIGVYGESKLRGEEAVLGASAEHLVARVSWVFGPDRPSFIDWILNKGMETENVEAIGDKWSTPSYTVDLAGMLRPFLREIECGGLLHASNAGDCTWREYGEYALGCAERAGAPVKTTTVKGIALADMKAFVAKRPVYTVLATEKLERLTGMKPRAWQEAVKEYVKGKFA